MKLEFDRRIIFSFIPFVVIAFFFWSGTILTGQHNNSKNIWMELNPPDDMVLLDNPLVEARLRLSGVGFGLIRVPSFSRKNPLRINLEKTDRELNKGKVVMLLNKQISNPNVTIEDVIFPPQRINMALKSVKKIPVELIAEIEYDKYFGPEGQIRLIPDSISISGPDSLIENIIGWKTEKLRFLKLRNTIDTDIRIFELPEYINSSTETVNLIIPVENYTEKRLTLPVLVQGEDSDHYIASPSNIEVSFLVGLSRYESIKAEDFTAAIFITPESQKVEQNPVVILSKPDYISIQFIKPSFVVVLPKKSIN